MDRIEAVIFDMDGTLLDSEPLFLKADLAVVAAHGGFMSPEEHDRYIGMGTRDFLLMIKGKYSIDASIEELTDFQNATYLELARSEIAVFPEMVKFARWAKEQGLSIAIASGSTNKNIEEMTALTKIRDLFLCRVSSAEVGKGKPEPDIFLETAKRLAVRPECCLVVEDSPFGVEAARRAGMACVAVPQPMAYDPKGYLESADICFPKGITEFRCDDLVQKLGDTVPQPV